MGKCGLARAKEASFQMRRHKTICGISPFNMCHQRVLDGGKQEYKGNVQWMSRYKSAPWHAQTSALNYTSILYVVGNTYLVAFSRRHTPT